MVSFQTGIFLAQASVEKGIPCHQWSYFYTTCQKHFLAGEHGAGQHGAVGERKLYRRPIVFMPIGVYVSFFSFSFFINMI